MRDVNMIPKDLREFQIAFDLTSFQIDMDTLAEYAQMNHGLCWFVHYFPVA